MTNPTHELGDFERDVLNAVTRLAMGAPVDDPLIRTCAEIMMRTPDMSPLPQRHPATPAKKSRPPTFSPFNASHVESIIDIMLDLVNGPQRSFVYDEFLARVLSSYHVTDWDNVRQAFMVSVFNGHIQADDSTGVRRYVQSHNS